MKLTACQVILVLVLLKNAKCCPPREYYSLDIPGCVLCPRNCADQDARDIKRCKQACENKSTPPTPGAPTTEAQKDTTASPPTTKTEIQPTTSETEGEKPKKNRTSRGDSKVGINFAVNTDPPDTKSSFSVVPIITAILGTFFLCGVVFLVYKIFTRQETSSVDERKQICVEPSTSDQGPSPGEDRNEIDGIRLPVSEIGDPDRIRLTESEFEFERFRSNLHLQETEV